MKKIFTLAVSTAIALAVNATVYKTPGTGEAYTLKKLAGISGSGVTKQGAGTYVISDSLTLSAGDSFSIDEDADSILLGDKVLVEFCGHADLRAKSGRVTITRAGEDAEPYYISLRDDSQGVSIEGLDVEYTGFRLRASQLTTVNNCTFRYYPGYRNCYYLLSINDSKASVDLRNSLFADNGASVIGGGANYYNTVKVENCELYRNQLGNANRPQINLTVGDSVVIRNCKIVGATSLTKVGGIAVSNMLGATGNYKTVIENCSIDSCRYGITVMGKQDCLIKGNKIRHNTYETNANNGGSGISVYDSTKKISCKITDNLIEDNLWGITVIGGGDVNVGKVSVDGVKLAESDAEYNPGKNVFKDNGNGGVLYDLYNNTTGTIYAQGNTWNVETQDSVNIEKVVWHKADFSTLGTVIFMPCAADIAAGISTVKASAATRQEVYAIDGRYVGDSLEAQPGGLYILRTAEGTRKVIK